MEQFKDNMIAFLTHAEIQEMVKRLGKEIQMDYHGREIIHICPLKGSCLFLADLVRNIELPQQVDFVQCTATEKKGAIRMAKKLYEETPEIFFYPDQYSNPANWGAHYKSTGPEILAQTDGRVTHFVAGMGTTGTMMGVGRFLREAKPDVTLISMQPDSPFNGLEGLKHLETAIVPPIYDDKVADYNVECRTEDAYAMVRHLAKSEGLLVGISAGGNVHTALQVAQKAPVGSVIVTILCDGADRYLSERFWDDDIPDIGPQI